MKSNLVGQLFPVLDHGHVRLVDYMGDDLAIVRSARVSFNAAWRAGEEEASDIKLLNYLIKNGHTSPFEAVVLTFDIKAPIFVFRQWHRHRTWSYNEMSARYTELPEEYYVPQASHIGTQSTNNKQARDMGAEVEASNYAWEISRYEFMCKQAFTVYKEHLARGWPRELARMVLPVSTYSQMFGTCDLHNLFQFLRLRLHPHAQYEIRVYAAVIMSILDQVVPHSAAAFRKHVLKEEA